MNAATKTTPKTRSLVVRVTDSEMDMIHQLAAETEDPIHKIVRRLIRDAWIERHGMTKPPPARLKHGKERGR